MAKSSTYSHKSVTLMIDGQLVVGVWEGDDAIEVAPGADVGSLLVGADGSSIFSQSADESATITIRLQHTSPAHRLLMQKRARQMAGRPVGFPVSLVDTISGEGGSTDQAFISQAPNDSKGVNAVAREWVLITGQWTPLIPLE